jgi:hypothetical protein
MPQLMWLYLTAWRYDRTTAPCVAMGEALQTVSHDRLTRMLQADGAGHIRLERACRMLCVWERGTWSSMTRSFRSPLRPRWSAWRGSSPARSAGQWMASRWSCSYGRMGPCGFLCACDSSGKGALPRTSWPWSGSARPATACVVTRRLRSLTPGSPPKLC